VEAHTFSLSGKIKGKTPPPRQCNQENDSDCCKDGKWYITYKCSPLLLSQMKATLTLNSFEKRCLKYINIYGNGKSMRAKVMDECDSNMGCDSDHDYQPPYPNNIVDALKVVWKALGVIESDWGEMDIY
ncbi:hypothetical protein Goshw_022442, partial [Gossypium schwendimanii]|nr:hypothetical protein [Gossypium schwendimanii]